MAAFHFCAKIHSRGKGASAVRAAAYRAAERLHDARAGRTEDYTRKADVVETAILAPAEAASWVQDRNDLWNRAEAAERRRDAQVAQELEINLPRELSEEENWQLITDFAREHLTVHGRVCDIAFHLGEASDGRAHPHAHILMPVRELSGAGFGDKHPDCSWRTFIKRRDRLGELREVWCDFARQRALDLGHDLGSDWDHRSFEDRGIDLEPQPKRGATAQRLDRDSDAKGHDTRAERTEALLRTQRRNGEQLLRDPMIALTALTHRHSTFTEAELARYIFQHSAHDQYAAIMAGARPLAITVGRDERGVERFSSAAMVSLEAGMVADAGRMAATETHTVNRQKIVGLRERLSPEQARAAAHLLTGADLACLTGYAGAGKSTLLNEARQAWEAQGYRVRGCALSGIAAENLEQGSGIADARTIASLEYAWERGRDQLTANDVLVVDEAGMIGSRGLARLITQARDAGTKIVLVGDAEQLQAIEAGAAFRAITERTGAAELTEIRRQQEPWQQQATRELATGQTGAALARYGQAGAIHMATTDLEARAQLVEQWNADRMAMPGKTRIMLAHTNDDVRALNEIAREELRCTGQLGLSEVTITTDFGERGFTAGDRLIFRRNDRGMGVRNGTLGTVAEIEPGRLAVTTDDGRQVELDPATYQALDHAYAVTVHKAQGVTVDQAHVLATRGFSRHESYVALSRHREAVKMVYSQEAFADDAELAQVLGRRRAKDFTMDYQQQPAPEPQPARSPEQQRADDIAQMFAEQAIEPERTWEIKPHDLGWGL